MEKPSHVSSRGEKWISQQLLRKKIAIFIARRNKSEFTAVKNFIAVRRKGDFAVRKKVDFAALQKKNRPYL